MTQLPPPSSIVCLRPSFVLSLPIHLPTDRLLVSLGLGENNRPIFAELDFQFCGARLDVRGRDKEGGEAASVVSEQRRVIVTEKVSENRGGGSSGRGVKEDKRCQGFLHATA